MKNLGTIIAFNKTLAQEIADTGDLARYNIKVSRVENPTVNGHNLFQPGLVYIKFEVPANKVTELANFEGDDSSIMADLRQAAKNYLAENAN